MAALNWAYMPVYVWILRIIWLAGIPVGLFAFVHAALQRAEAFTAVDKLTKIAWLGITGAAAVVLLKEGKILLERQWRYPLGRAFWEVPAGKLEAGEDPALCAARELEEETGYASDTWTPLGTICPGIGYSNEVISLYLAENPRKGSRHLDPGEFLDLAWIPFEEAVRMAETGEIDDAKTIGALFRAEKCLEKRTGIKR